jgi:hypothetical protein
MKYSKHEVGTLTVEPELHGLKQSIQGLKVTLLSVAVAFRIAEILDFVQSPVP